jgi:hypothetical protein
VSVNETTKLPDGSKCPAFALVVRDTARMKGKEERDGEIDMEGRKSKGEEKKRRSSKDGSRINKQVDPATSTSTSISSAAKLKNRNERGRDGGILGEKVANGEGESHPSALNTDSSSNNSSGSGSSDGACRRGSRECLLVIRGTASNMDWSINMDDLSVPFSYRTGSLSCSCSLPPYPSSSTQVSAWVGGVSMCEKECVFVCGC